MISSLILIIKLNKYWWTCIYFVLPSQI